MKTEILHCNACNLYTLQKTCPGCSQRTITTKPAKYSPEDKYGTYRRKAKKNS